MNCHSKTIRQVTLEYEKMISEATQEYEKKLAEAGRYLYEEIQKIVEEQTNA